MSFESFVSNVEAVALDMGYRFPLREEDLKIHGYAYTTDAEGARLAYGTVENKAERLFLEHFLKEHPTGDEIVCNDEFRSTAAGFFAETWDEEPSLAAIKAAKTITIVWKNQLDKLLR